MMTLTEIFNQYFRRKLLIYLSIGLIVGLIRHFRKHDVSLPISLVILLIILVIVFVNGWMDYRYYEVKVPKLVLQSLDESPLKEFVSTMGFIKEDNDKLSGDLSAYHVALAPLLNHSREKYLLILIPLELREGLDDYFATGIANDFRLSLGDNVLCAERLVTNYDKKFDHSQLVELLNQVTADLKSKNINPLKISKD